MSDEYSVVWICEDCGNKTDMDPTGFSEHLKSAHGVADTRHLKGTKSLNMHMRGAGYSLRIYNWEIAGKQFTQSITRGKAPGSTKPAATSPGPVNPPKQQQLEL